MLHAQDGGSLTYYAMVITEDPALQSIQLVYVEPVDDTWFTVTGIELEVTPRFDPREMMP